MALADFLANLDELARQAVAAFEAAGDLATLETARVCFLGAKSGRLKAAQQELGKVPRSDKPAAGKRFILVRRSCTLANLPNLPPSFRRTDP